MYSFCETCSKDRRRNISKSEKKIKLDEQYYKCDGVNGFQSCPDNYDIDLTKRAGYKKAEFHHRFAYGDGGPSELWNITALCHQCHKAITKHQSTNYDNSENAMTFGDDFF